MDISTSNPAAGVRNESSPWQTFHIKHPVSEPYSTKLFDMRIRTHTGQLLEKMITHSNIPPREIPPIINDILGSQPIEFIAVKNRSPSDRYRFMRGHLLNDDQMALLANKLFLPKHISVEDFRHARHVDLLAFQKHLEAIIQWDNRDGYLFLNALCLYCSGKTMHDMLADIYSAKHEQIEMNKERFIQTGQDKPGSANIENNPVTLSWLRDTLPLDRYPEFKRIFKQRFIKVIDPLVQAAADASTGASQTLHKDDVPGTTVAVPAACLGQEIDVEQVRIDQGHVRDFMKILEVCFRISGMDITTSGLPLEKPRIGYRNRPKATKELLPIQTRSGYWRISFPYSEWTTNFFSAFEAHSNANGKWLEKPLGHTSQTLLEELVTAYDTANQAALRLRALDAPLVDPSRKLSA